ncbi:MAG: hypothetical protein M1817_005587 [Caeruleum heppii]|nr:MAG: hypothetical protein M1817_005587 [Caeruleum heppii]
MLRRWTSLGETLRSLDPRSSGGDVDSQSLDDRYNLYSPVSHPTPERHFLIACGFWQAPALPARTYTEYVRAQTLNLTYSRWEPWLVRTKPDPCVTMDDVFAILSHMATRIYSEESRLTVDSIVESLMLDKLIHVADVKDAPDPLRHLIFQCIGMTTMLVPVSSYISESKLELPPWHLPVAEAFYPQLPVEGLAKTPHGHNSMYSSDFLYVSLLNAKTLDQVGHITIVWVEVISLHLVFQIKTLTLYIFCLPSYCKLQAHMPFHRSILRDYSDQPSAPSGFSPQAFMAEIEASYQLIFADDYGSRAHFRNKEWKRARSIFSDPYLQKICQDPQAGARSYYDKKYDFPILSDRLSTLQNYMQSQNPGTMKALWRDRRNPLQWYTFWAVFFVGGLSVILATLQVGLSAAQLYYTIKYVR